MSDEIVLIYHEDGTREAAVLNGDTITARGFHLNADGSKCTEFIDAGPFSRLINRDELVKWLEDRMKQLEDMGDRCDTTNAAAPYDWMRREVKSILDHIKKP